MTSLELRRTASQYEKQFPTSTLHEAFINGALWSKGHPVFEKEEVTESVVEDSGFEEIWNLYAKKRSRKTCLNKWKKLSPAIKAKIFEHVPKYVESTPDVRFRKDFATYLNQECWNDEIIPHYEQRREPTQQDRLDAYATAILDAGRKA